MPELPEVEVLRRSLEPELVGRAIESVAVHNRALREPVNARVLGRRAKGPVEALRRRAKYLLIDLANGSTLVVHLGMSGRLTLVPGDSARHPHEHVAFGLDDGRRLRFRDARRFGLVFALARSRIAGDRHFRHLGIEPLGGELSGERLRSLAGRGRAPVKSFLMDSRRVVGVGNIYACEALFRAGIHPRRSVARIGRERWDGLAESVHAVLERAIAEGGTTLNDFADGSGNAGYFQVSLEVYGREGERCRRCGGSVRRIVQSGRSTFYCPGCQR